MNSPLIRPAPPLPPEDLEHVLRHTQQEWAVARGARIFITGGTGFFGIWLLETLLHINEALRLDLRATILTRSPRTFAERAPHLVARPELTFVAGDMTHFSVPPGDYDFLIHAATEIPSGPLADPDGAAWKIAEGTRQVLAFAADRRVKRLLLTSSGAVYGPQPSDCPAFTEDFRGSPDSLAASSAYGLAKRFSEFLAVTHAARLGYVATIARCFAFVGPHLPLDGHYAMGNFLRDGLANRPIVITGDGRPMRSYLYAADMAIWLWTILLRGAAGRAYNVGAAESCSLRDVARLVSDAYGLATSPVCQKEPDPLMPAPRYVPDTSRARSELGLAETIPLPEAIQRTIAWLKTLPSHLA